MADIVFPGKDVGGVLGRDFLPSNFDLELYKGDYLPLKITLRNPVTSAPINLTGHTPSAQVRAHFGDAVIYPFSVSVPDPTNGQVNLTLTSAVTSLIEPGAYIWDFQVREPNGNVRTYIAGDVTVFNEVTKE